MFAATCLVLVVGGVIIYKGCGCTGQPQTPVGPGSTGPATAASGPAAVDLLAGAWEGDWASESKPLKGRLAATIEKRPDGTYLAHFESESFLGTDKSDCIFRVTSRNGSYEFEGKEDLGFLKGGVYTYHGTADGKNFDCNYDSSFDKGKFRMQKK